MLAMVKLVPISGPRSLALIQLPAAPEQAETRIDNLLFSGETPLRTVIFALQVT